MINPMQTLLNNYTMTKDFTRSQLSPLPEYFDRYINVVDDVSVIRALELSIDEIKNAPIEKWRALGQQVYAPGKWTINDIIQHIIDAERVFCYRALSFARGEQKVMPFDEELWGRNAKASNRKLDDLLDELLTVRKGTIHMYNSFKDEMLVRVGIGFKGEYSVHDLGFIIAGHQRWHLNVIRERYLPLVSGK
jgi:hypothetical protein